MKKIKTNPFTHQKINVDKTLNDIKRQKKVQKEVKKFIDTIEQYRKEKENEAIKLNMVCTNFKPEYKFNWLKLLDTVMYLIACGAMAFIITTVLIQWIA